MAFKGLPASVFLKNGCICLSGEKKGRDNKDNFPVAYKPCESWIDFHFFTCHFFIVCHWRPFYQDLQSIPVGRNSSELLERETSKLVLRACALFFRRTEAEGGNSLFKNRCGFLPELLYSEAVSEPFKGLHSPLHGAVLRVKRGRHKHTSSEEDRADFYMLQHFVCAYENWHHGAGMLTVFCILLAVLTGKHVFQREFSIFISLCFHNIPVLFWM